MSGEFSEYRGDNYEFGPIRMKPVPSQPVPIIVGGHAKPALRRAARLGDGWVSVRATSSFGDEVVGRLD